MKERPILFSAPMVRAILSGQKTMTRRVIKAPSIKLWAGRPNEWRNGLCFHGSAQFNNGPSKQPSPHSIIIECPYGQPGDRLWVREAFFYENFMPDDCPGDLPGGLSSRRIIYRASQPDYPIHTTGLERWTPSIYMPRWASRITLEITNVIVERLNDISEEDAKAEGVDLSCGPLRQDYPNYKRTFHSLWESINGPGSWDANPWVWVVELKRVEP